jgi:hypothetical protein
MQDKTCPVFVDGKECGLPLTPVDLEAKQIGRYDLVKYECGLGHRIHFLLELKSKARPSDTTREQIQRKIDELTRNYAETRDPEIRKEIYELAGRFRGMDK